MKVAERLIDGFLERFGIRKRLDSANAQQLVDLRELQKLHGAFLKNFIDQRNQGHVCSINPYVAVD